MGGGRALKVKVMVGGGRRSIRAPAKLGPGEMNAGVNEGVDGGRAAEMQRDEGWNLCREPHVTCDLIALRTASRDVEGCRWKVRSISKLISYYWLLLAIIGPGVPIIANNDD